MSSKHNHMVRSHRSEHLKSTAFGGFKPAISPNRNKYAAQTKLARGPVSEKRGQEQGQGEARERKEGGSRL